MYNKPAACVRSVGEGVQWREMLAFTPQLPLSPNSGAPPPHHHPGGGERGKKKNELSDQEALSNIIRQKERWNLEEINLLGF